MLDHEYAELLERLDSKRGEKTIFFVFADTVATRRRTRTETGHGWLGIRFQDHPRRAPSEIIIHVQMLDRIRGQPAGGVGIIGVNLIYGAYLQVVGAEGLLKSLLDGLTRRRFEVDIIKFSGPAFSRSTTG